MTTRNSAKRSSPWKAVTRKSDSGPGPVGEARDGLYEVDCILGRRSGSKIDESEYLVRWKGYGSDDDSWEPEWNLWRVGDLIRKYDSKSSPSKNSSPKKMTTSSSAKTSPSPKKQLSEPAPKKSQKKKTPASTTSSTTSSVSSTTSRSRSASRGRPAAKATPTKSPSKSRSQSRGRKAPSVKSTSVSRRSSSRSRASTKATPNASQKPASPSKKKPTTALERASKEIQSTVSKLLKMKHEESKAGTTPPRSSQRVASYRESMTTSSALSDRTNHQQTTTPFNRKLVSTTATAATPYTYGAGMYGQQKQRTASPPARYYVRAPRWLRRMTRRQWVYVVMLALVLLLLSTAYYYNRATVHKWAGDKRKRFNI